MLKHYQQKKLMIISCENYWQPERSSRTSCSARIRKEINEEEQHYHLRLSCHVTCRRRCRHSWGRWEERLGSAAPPRPPPSFSTFPSPSWSSTFVMIFNWQSRLLLFSQMTPSLLFNFSIPITIFTMILNCQSWLLLILKWVTKNCFHLRKLMRSLWSHFNITVQARRSTEMVSPKVGSGWLVITGGACVQQTPAKPLGWSHNPLSRACNQPRKTTKACSPTRKSQPASC